MAERMKGTVVSFLVVAIKSAVILAVIVVAALGLYGLLVIPA